MTDGERLEHTPQISLKRLALESGISQSSAINATKLLKLMPFSVLTVRMVRPNYWKFIVTTVMYCGSAGEMLCAHQNHNSSGPPSPTVLTPHIKIMSLYYYLPFQVFLITIHMSKTNIILFLPDCLIAAQLSGELLMASNVLLMSSRSCVPNIDRRLYTISTLAPNCCWL